MLSLTQQDLVHPNTEIIPSFVLSSEISTKTIRIPALNFYHQLIELLELRPLHFIT